MGDIVQEICWKVIYLYKYPRTRIHSQKLSPIDPLHLLADAGWRAASKGSGVCGKWILVLTHLPLSTCIYIYSSAPYRHQTPLQSLPTDVQNIIFPVAWNMITYQLKIFTDITRSLLQESAGFMQMKEGPWRDKQQALLNRRQLNTNWHGVVAQWTYIFISLAVMVSVLRDYVEISVVP
jgi:hypothetical protein